MNDEYYSKDYKFIYAFPINIDEEFFLHDVARHEASAMFGECLSRWMIWLADEVLILGFVHQDDYAKFAERWHLVFRQLLDEGSLT